VSRMIRPSPKATTNISTPMPAATPTSAGRPRTTPTFAPVAVSTALLGPGVPATTIEKPRNARVCSGVIAGRARVASRLAAWRPA
jgi:hypothetical protein